MSSDTIDRILRYGAGPEFADLFEAVGVMRALYTLKDASNGEYEIAALGVVQCYDACVDAVTAFDREIDKFQAEPETKTPDRKEDASPA